MSDPLPSYRLTASDPKDTSVFLLGFASFFWVGLCLLNLRLHWLSDDAGPSFGLAWELAAAIPLLAWTVWLLKNPAHRLSKEQWGLVFVLAIFLRLILYGLHPIQSDDLYRYIWEGRIQLNGFNPYTVPPDSQLLWPLRTDMWYEINHPDLPAIYPPLAQWCFIIPSLISSLSYDHVGIIKVVFFVLELTALLIFANWLDRTGRSRAWAALWAFHPLMIVEFSGNGHLDSLMLLALLSSLALLERFDAQNPKSEIKNLKSEIFHPLASIALLAAAILAKIIPVLLAPFYVWRLGRRWWWLALVPLLIVLAYLPYLGDGPRAIFHSTNAYAWTWSGNGPAFELLRRVFDDGYRARHYYWGAVALFIAILWMFRFSPRRAALPVFSAFLVLSPIVHPWYLTLLLPLAIDAASRAPTPRRQGIIILPFLWLTALAPLDYTRQALDDPPVWTSLTLWLLWVPFFILLLPAVTAAMRPLPVTSSARPHMID